MYRWLLLPFFLTFSLWAGAPKSVCLNMIVKNESACIERCLESVKSLIDYWVIYDTGSTDGTQQKIADCLKEIPGELHETPWVDFAHNRNEALRGAKGKGDYVLFIDADEKLEYSPDFSLPPLDKDFYYFTVRQLNAVDFKRIGLINNHLPWKWEGVLHEVITCPEAKTGGALSGVLNLCNTTDGARAQDPKTAWKDAQILEKALEKEPTNSRYAYYLGQSYFNAKEYALAKKSFERRSQMESTDVQETFLSLYNKGLVEEKLGEETAALQSFFKAHAFFPHRAEPLFRAAVLYRKQGNYLLGYLLAKHALSFPYPTEDLCVEYPTYDYAILIELANCALLMGHFSEGLQASLKLLANPRLPEDIRPLVLGNCEVARVHLDKSATQPKELP
jgi:tetratricopeptide (TPR) repeat protein